MTGSQYQDEPGTTTPDLQSDNSESLCRSRPNRWQGPLRKWRAITEEDRLNFKALERLRNQDLALHLYNAFVLRQAPKNNHSRHEGQDSDAEEDIDAATGQPVHNEHNEHWAPPKIWTAWPLSVRLVPPDDLMKRTIDDDEPFTFRRLERESPSTNLEDVVSASVLRFAKERFHERRLGETATKDRGVTTETQPFPPGTLPPGQPVSLGDENINRNGSLMDQSQGGPRLEAGTFKPAISTDDETSYELIRPSTRAILDKLDKVLAILHNDRMSTVQNFTDAVASSYDDEYRGGIHLSRVSQSASQRPSPPPSPPPSTPIPRSPSRSSMSADGEKIDLRKAEVSTGRPSSPRQMGGESGGDVSHGRARAPGKGQPVFMDKDDGNARKAVTESLKRSRKRKRRQKVHRNVVKDRTYYRVRQRLKQFKLRDWRGVMGAAALAGFPPSIIARATQRCANLFGQGMEIHYIDEKPFVPGDTGVITHIYQPGDAMPSVSSETEGDYDNLRVRWAWSMSYPPSEASSKEERPTKSGDEEFVKETSIGKAQKRSISRNEGSHCCPYADCSRASRGFGRPYNLKRHLKIVHGQENVDEVIKTAAWKDELDGCVHRDGFLQPIRVRRGWRAEDKKKRRQRTPITKIQRDESSTDDEMTSPDLEMPNRHDEAGE